MAGIEDVSAAGLVRLESIDAFEQQRYARAILGFLSDEDRAVRMRAVHALSRIYGEM